MVVGFQTGKGSIEHFPARNDDNIKACGDLPAPEHLAGEALGAVAIGGGTNLSRGRNAQPRLRPAVGQDEQRHEPAVDARALPVCPFELRSAANSLRGRERLPRTSSKGLAAHAGS